MGIAAALNETDISPQVRVFSGNMAPVYDLEGNKDEPDLNDLMSCSSNADMGILQIQTPRSAGNLININSEEHQQSETQEAQ